MCVLSYSVMFFLINTLTLSKKISYLVRLKFLIDTEALTENRQNNKIANLKKRS